MKQRPCASSVSVIDGTPLEYGNHVVRHLSAMKRSYLDGQVYAATAIALQLRSKPSAGNRLRLFVTAVHSGEGLDLLKQMFESAKTGIVFEYILSEDPMHKVRIEDNWLYLLPGWMQVSAQVYHQEIAGKQFDRLALIAGEITR